MSEETETYVARLAKLKELNAKGRDPFAIERFDRSHKAAEVACEVAFSSLDGTHVTVAGRVVARRKMGKASFCNIEDQSGRIQLYVRGDELGDAAYQLFLDMDLGDIVGAVGSVFRTNSGEISIRASEITLLAKALRSPPTGKVDDQGLVHGALADVEDRYRRRYLDFLANPAARDLVRRRSVAISTIRRWLDDHQFIEIETPVLQNVAGGALARPFVTHHNALDLDLKLRISLELYLKRLIIGGFERVYEIGRVFRNEGVSPRHSPEFSLMELYQAYANLEEIMELVEEMYIAVATAVNGSPMIACADGAIDLAQRPWRRLAMNDGIAEFAGIRPEELASLEQAKAACRRVGAPLDLAAETTLGGLIEKLHEVYTQPHLLQPTFIVDFPVETSPLAKRSARNPAVARRFELYIASQELGNAFSELNDPVDQRQRFEEQVRQNEAGNAEAHPMDTDFLEAMEYGMPPTGGLGIGIDRLVMVLTNTASIRDVIPFPLLRPR
ncbi:MAG: lysine--tRNA ligase [Armatimonadetes bacterium]|nr:lysine--tRNA ligase [Armatimonadota bacterium]MDE2207236.1 lysine--tRNA ligase [Armatimonadota bacterium]